MNRLFRHLGPIFFIAYLLVGSFVHIGSASAANVSGRWTSSARIVIGDKVYIDGDIIDDDRLFYLNNKSSDEDCADYIGDIHGQDKFGTLFHRSIVTSGRFSGCQANKDNPSDAVTLSFSSFSDIDYVFVDEEHIKRVDSRVSYTYNAALDGNFFEDDKTCKDKIDIDRGTYSTTDVKTEALLFNYEAESSRTTNCVQKGNAFHIIVGNLAASDDPVAPAPDDTGENPSTTTIADSCDSTGGVLAWVVCPVIKMLDGITSTLDSAIRAQLETANPNGTCDISDDASNEECDLFKAWGRLRNIALIMLVPIMLVMVIGTALGFSFVDAYTVKRAMPRFLIAVLFISMSWYITAFMIDLTNVVGRGILGLMTQPFGLADKSLADLISVPSGAAASGLVIVGGIIAAAGGSLSLGIAFSFAMVAAVAIFLAFIVLVLRQIAIITLVLLAPLAILSWIFPNADRGWKLWWGTFTKLLLMYPLIMLLIGAGRVAASIIPLQQGSDSLFTQILVIIAYVAPFFFIPATFKFAGGIFANLAGIINDRGRGFFDKQRERRAKEREDLKKRAGAGVRFNPNNPLMRQLYKQGEKKGWRGRAARIVNPNRVGEFSSSPYKAAAYYSRNKKIPFLSNKGKFIAAGVEHESFEQTTKLFQLMNGALANNDKAYRAIGGLHSGLSEATQARFREAGLYGRALTSQDDLLAAGEILSQSDDHTEQVAGTALKRSAPTLANKYRDPEMMYGSVAAAAALGLGVHGFAIDEDIPQIGRSITGETGNAELADSMLVQTELALASSNPFLKAGYGHRYDPDAIDPVTGKRGVFLSAKQAGRDLAVIETAVPGAMAAAKTGAIRDQRSTFDFILKYAEPSADVKAERISVVESQGAEKVRSISTSVAGEIKRTDPDIDGEALAIQVQQHPLVVAARQEAEQNVATVTAELSAPSEGARAAKVIDDRVERIMADPDLALEVNVRRANPTMSDSQVRAKVRRQAAQIVRNDPRYKSTARIAQAHRMGDSFKQQMLFSTASRYSQASVANKTEVMEIIDSDPDLRREFEMFEGRAAKDPEIRAMIEASNRGAQAIQAQGAELAQRLTTGPQIVQKPTWQP